MMHANSSHFSLETSSQLDLFWGICKLVNHDKQSAGLFIEVIVDLKFCVSPFPFSFPALSCQGFYHHGVSPQCFLFAQR